MIDMCGGGAPKPPPAMPVYSQVALDEDIQARNNARRRMKGAMNTRASILSTAWPDSGVGGKTLLGQ